MPFITPDSGQRIDLRTVYQFNCAPFNQYVMTDILSSADSATIETGLYVLQIGAFQPGATYSQAYYTIGVAGPFYMRKGWYQTNPTNMNQTISTHRLYFNGAGTPQNTQGSYIRVQMDTRQSGGSPFPYFSTMLQIYSTAFSYIGDGSASMRLYKIAQT